MVIKKCIKAVSNFIKTFIKTLFTLKTFQEISNEYKELNKIMNSYYYYNCEESKFF